MTTSGTQTFTFTAAEIIALALLDVGSLAIGESPTAAETADAIKRLNMFIAALAADGIHVYKRDTQTFNTVAGTADYNLATGTLKLINMYTEVDNVDTCINMLDYADYDSIYQKDTPGVPTDAGILYTTYPPSVSLYPVPENVYTVTYRRMKMFDIITVDTEEMDFPMLGLSMIVKGLAYELSSSYQLTPEEKEDLKAKYQIARSTYLANNTERTGQEIKQPRGVMIV